jgi:FkbM family methyltransferase
MILNFEEIIKKYNLQINGIIHIGAHEGEEVSIYETNNIKNIICFEPLEEAFIKLAEKCENKYDFFQLALGNENKQVQFNVASNNQSSSILKPKLHLTQHPTITFNKTIIIEMSRLDDVMVFYHSNKINKNKKFNFINIDVQGYELEVFKGAEKYLNNIDYIMTEVNNDFVYEKNAKIEEIDDFLNKYNFKRKETNWAGKTWGDAFYIKS